MEVRLYSYLRLQAGTRVLSLALAKPTPLAEVLSSIIQSHPKLARIVLTVDGQPAAHLVVTINGHPWRREEDAQPMIRDEDRLDLFLAIGGGETARPGLTLKKTGPSGRAEA
jgi:sulfur carrier protein ThiS